MGFLGKFIVRKPDPVVGFSEDRPQLEMKLPDHKDGSVFGWTNSSDELDGADEKSHWEGGALDHVYRSRLGFNKETCPLCSGETKQKYVTLIYASNYGNRQSMSPSAWICEPCSCVVLDEAIIAQTAKLKGYSYFVPVGMASSNAFFETRKPELNLFKTYEGKKPVFVFDEGSKDVADVIYVDEINTSTCFPAMNLGSSQKNQLSEEKKRQKRKASKEARKKQRH